MKQWVSILSSVLVLYSIWQPESAAQPKSISSIWSFNGIGLGYEHSIDDNSFIEAELRAEMTEIFIYMKNQVGATASFTWNTVFARHESRNGHTISWFSGPGAIAGFAGDYKTDTGGIFGLRYRIGAECVFDRKISLSASLAPILGMHLSVRNDAVHMRLYRHGLLYGFLPEVGIKYIF